VIRFENTKPAMSNDEILDDMRSVAVKLGLRSLTQRAYEAHGSFSTTVVKSRFGSWNKGAQAAGLAVAHRRDVSVDELFANLMEVWSQLGRQPRKREMMQPISRYTHDPYVRHFGGWLNAVRQFVASADSGLNAGAGATLQKPIGRGPRDPSLRLRFLVMRRDRFMCRHCGRSPARNAGLELEIDHVVPWSEGGATSLENLQTLCLRCNAGKSNLPAADG
jgi:hypothetical protein